MNQEANPIQQDILNRLAVLQQRNRLAHAYLFTGPAFVGKSETALSIAKMLNCEKSPLEKATFCEQCPSCLKIKAGHHPDVHMTQGSLKEPITIEQVRAILDQVKMRPLFSQYKIFILKNVEYFTQEAANALLKTLEEPVGHCLLMLTTPVPEKVLDTVTSRCQQVNFACRSAKELTGVLTKEYRWTQDSAQGLSNLSEGCLGKAAAMNEQQLWERKNKMIDGFIFSQDSEDLMKEVLAETEKTKEFLQVLLSWLRDAVLLKVNVHKERLVHVDRLKDLTRFQQKFSFFQLQELYHEGVNMVRLMTENLNIKIPLLIIKEKVWTR